MKRIGGIIGLIAVAAVSGHWAWSKVISAELGGAGVNTEAGLIWADEFNGPELDRSKWTLEESCWGGGNNERQCYVDSPDTIRVEDGALILSALKRTHTGLEFPQNVSNRGRAVTKDYISGKVRSLGRASWTYGRFEARIKLSKGQSLWPAFWMLPESNVYGGWPKSGEIDIMEAVNLGTICERCPDMSENRVSGALHFGKPWPENSFKTQSKSLEKHAVEQWHVYALDWREDKMQWSVDGEVYFTASSDDWFTEAIEKTQNSKAPFDQPFYLMFNLAAGGNLPDGKNEKAFNPASFPADMKIDWVRVYE